MYTRIIMATADIEHAHVTLYEDFIMIYFENIQYPQLSSHFQSPHHYMYLIPWVLHDTNM